MRRARRWYSVAFIIMGSNFRTSNNERAHLTAPVNRTLNYLSGISSCILYLTVFSTVCSPLNSILDATSSKVEIQRGA